MKKTYKRILASLLIFMIAISYIPILDNLALAQGQIDIQSITPAMVSSGSGRIVTITGTGFGQNKAEITSIKIIPDGADDIITISSDNIVSIKDTEMTVKIPKSIDFIGQAYLTIEREEWGSDSILFNYINDPQINKIIVNTEIKIERDNDGNIITRPDGSIERSKATYLELYGYYFNLPGQKDNIEPYIELRNQNSTMSAEVVSQAEGYVKVKLPENFEYGDEYKITLRNKYGGVSNYPAAADQYATINLANHDITQMSNLKVNIGDILTIRGTEFPLKENLEVYIGDENGEKKSVIKGEPTATEVKVTVPQVASTSYQNLKVVDISNNTAITLLDELEIRPAPTPITVTAVTPDSGTRQGGTEVKIIGINLTSDMKVKFGDNYALNVQYDSEASEDGTTVLKAITPSSNIIGPVDVTVENPQDNGSYVLRSGFTYTEVQNSLVVGEISPTEGYETGGETVSISGLNFQRTKQDDNGDVISDEGDYNLAENKRSITFINDTIKNYSKPGTDEKVDVTRVRTIRVYFGGELADIQLIDQEGEDIATIINPDSGQQILRVKTPQVALNPREKTPVDVSVEVLTEYYEGKVSISENGELVDAGGAPIDKDEKLVDNFTEREKAIWQYTYKPVPSSPELKVVYNQKLNMIPMLDETEDKTMAKGPADSATYIYGLDIRPEAKVYFFKEGTKPLNELLVPANEGNVIDVATLEGAQKGKTINRVEVEVPNISELGPVTVLVVNKDGGRTKTSLEFLDEGTYTEDSKEFEMRHFQLISTPEIDSVIPPFGSTNYYDEEGQLVTRNPMVVLYGDRFLVEAEVDDEDKTERQLPSVYVIPNTISTNRIVQAHNISEEEYMDYKAEIFDVTLEKDDDLISVDGVKDILGTRMVVKMPAVAPDNQGYRDIVVINPDGGVGRYSQGFEYRRPTTRPEILSITPDKGNVDGGEEVTIIGKDFEYSKDEVLVTVTIDGELAEIKEIKRILHNDEEAFAITIITPKGTEGEKILQVINQDGGTAEGTYSYTIVETDPIIWSVIPGHGGPYTEVTIIGEDFVVPDPSSDDEGKRIGTRVFFNDYEITNRTDEDGNVLSQIEIIDKETIRVVLPEDMPIGMKDVEIKNPDTAGFELIDAFMMLDPGSNPVIDDIEPNEGSKYGGTTVIISGTGFREDGLEVWFGTKRGIKPRLDIEGNIIVVTPSYEFDEKAKDSESVSVQVINKDGGSDTVRDGFTFRIPRSNPEIDKLLDKETKLEITNGPKAGNYEIIIKGDDFRYKDMNQNGRLDIGDLLPKVYFEGENVIKEALNVEYINHDELIVTVPTFPESAKVDIVVINPDAGNARLQGGFTFEKSKPIIKAITPGTINTIGGISMDIIGEGFEKYDRDYEEIEGENVEYATEIDVEVIFGNRSNYETISETSDIVEVIVGNITVQYDNKASDGTNNVTVKLNDQEEATFNIKRGQSKIILLPTGEDEEKLEGIKIEYIESNIIVTRQLAPVVKLDEKGTWIEVITPPLSSIMQLPTDIIVSVINPDGEVDQRTVNVESDTTNLSITDIEPKVPVYKEGSEEIDYYVVESTLDGEMVFTIYGTDFRKGVEVMVGNRQAEVISRSNEEDEIVVRAPIETDEELLDKELRIRVKNSGDGTPADSTQIEGENGPIWFVYRPRLTQPFIEEVKPNSGSAKGGEEIRIIGDQFTVDSIEDITVKIGTKEAIVDIERSTYKELVVITPSSDILEPVDVYVRNNKKRGEFTFKGGFTYYSHPQITHISPNTVYNTDNQKVTISGVMFMEGVKVYIGEVEALDVVRIDENTLEITTPAGEIGEKDVTIENTDGGSYTRRNGITYILPIPESPTGFVAYPGNERSITLRWNESEGAVKYKIFGREGTKGDYVFLGETEGLEYIIKDLKPNTRYYFRLWSINKYGESDDYDYDSATTLKSKDDDGDSKYDEKEETKAVIKSSSNGIIVDLPSKYDSREYNLDLTDSKYNNHNSIQINIPVSAITKSTGTVYVNTKDIRMYVPLYNISSSIYYMDTKNDDNDANVIIKLTKLSKQEKDRITKNLSRKETPASDAYSIEIMIQNGRQTQALEIKEGINLGIMSRDKGEKEDIYIGLYNPAKNTMDKQDSNATQTYDSSIQNFAYLVYGQIKKDGKYILIKSK